VGKLLRKSAAASDRAQPSVKVVMHGEVSGSKGERMGIRSDFLWGLGFPVMSKRIASRVFSLVWVALDERLNFTHVVGENCLQEANGPVRRRQVLGDLT